MSISRRKFLLSTAVSAGYILPSFYRQALKFLDRTGVPLIDVPAGFKTELIAVPYADDRYELFIGNPYQDPPQLTIRQLYEKWLKDEHATWHQFLEEWEIDESEADQFAGDDHVEHYWFSSEHPAVLAFNELVQLDLGEQFNSPNAVVGLEFPDGGGPGDDSLHVYAEGLKQLNKPFRVTLYQAGL